MVLEDRIPLTKFALHHVDRDPENGMYGGSRILTEEYGDLDVTSFDVGQGIVRAQDIWKRHEPLVFKLQPTDGKSDLNFFKEKIVARWQELEPDYVDDENYTDYLPAHYENLADMKAGKMIIWCSGKPFEMSLSPCGPNQHESTDAATIATPPMNCCVCSKPNPNRRRCARCKIAFYCSQSCQQIDWGRGHKNTCVPFKPD